MQSHNPDKADLFAESESAAAPKTNMIGKIWRCIVTRRRIPRRRPIGRLDGHFDPRLLNHRLLEHVGLTRGDLLRPIRRTDLPF